jgi:hypothetical protein
MVKEDGGRERKEERKERRKEGRSTPSLLPSYFLPSLRG